MSPLPATAYPCLGLTCPVTEALDPAKWRDRYAWGHNLGGSDDLRTLLRRCGGDVDALERLVEGIPDRVISWHLRAAMSQLESKLGISFGLVRYVGQPVGDLRLGEDYEVAEPARPWTVAAASDYCQIVVRPSLVSVQRLRALVWGQVALELTGTDAAIMVTDLRRGILNVAWSRVRPELLTPAAQVALGLAGRSGPSPSPGVWAVDYTCGPWAEYGGHELPGQIEVELADWIGLTAGLRVLAMAGSAASGGVSSTSLSMDGLSKSVSLTASAIYGLYSALENAYKEATKGIDWQRLRRYKHPPRVRRLSASVPR